ncbi:O-antigen polysaccharide polymerase Wzy [Nostoc sp. UHCC 0870]|uniref:O-antigen polysaccharide polymerase Wzy n=1 Tax=Nostoc sp. UHCC 0870 TaxID=2914041 RepID=UPI001EDE8E5B|nr:O-antigen polysaccharide polymerase Wzy [Nostoc sp. UHCC 0870]UKO97598.1 O-antigen polysaccharide polymerase Wzy family protein [Nostoc sp. UHCC 0870]
MKINTIKPNHKHSEIIIATHLFMMMILIIFRLLYEPFDSQPESLIYPFSWVVCIQAIWSFWSWYILTKNLFSPYLLFLLSAFLFNAGQAFVEVFHLNKDGLLGGFDFILFSFATLLNSLFLVILSLGAWHLGALISFAKSPVNEQKISPKSEDFYISSKYCYRVGIFFLSISLLPAIHTIRNNLSLVMASGYSGLYQVENATSVSAIPNILSIFLIPSALFILVGSAYQKKAKFISIIIVLIYSIIQFIVGQRNQGVMPLISFFWLWHQVICPIPKTFLLGLGSLIMFILIPVIAVIRNIGSQDRLSINFLIETFANIDNPIVAAISEMGSSMLTVAATLDLVPNVRSFQMGTDYLYALFTLVPNYFGGIHPTVARGIPEQWLVEEINPYFAMHGGSYGFSFIAEAYLNFGWIGTPIALGIMGFMFAKFTLWISKSGEPAKMAMLASFLSFFLFFPRAESALLIRPLLWYSLLPYWIVSWLGKKRSKKLAR